MQREDHACTVLRRNERSEVSTLTALECGKSSSLHDAAHDPAADEIDGQRDRVIFSSIQTDSDRESFAARSPTSRCDDFIDRFGEIGFLHAVGQHQRRGRIGSVKNGTRKDHI